MQGMIGREAHVALTEYHYWDGKTLRQGDQMPDRLRIPPHCARDNQGSFGGREHGRRGLDRLGVGIEAPPTIPARWG